MNNGGLIGKANTPTLTIASGIWRMEEVQDSVKNSIWPGDRIPPITTNLLAVYDGLSWDGTKWNDIYGSYHATTIKGTVTSTDVTGNGATQTFKTLQGATTAGIRFPSGILPATYTLFHVTRTTGGDRKRIVTGLGNNWLSGHWSGSTGVAYHEGWLTGQTNIHGNNWFISTDQNSLYRSNGVTRGSSGGSASTNLTINDGQFGEYSDWQCAFVCVYSGTMSSIDYASVESWISSKFGITI
jgi:hypothetical protein